MSMQKFSKSSMAAAVLAAGSVLFSGAGLAAGSAGANNLNTALSYWQPEMAHSGDATHQNNPRVAKQSANKVDNPSGLNAALSFWGSGPTGRRLSQQTEGARVAAYQNLSADTPGSLNEALSYWQPEMSTRVDSAVKQDRRVADRYSNQ